MSRLCRLRSVVACCIATWCGLFPTFAASLEDAWSARGDAAFKQSIDPLVVVNAFAEDRRGFLWLGSQAGLLRWDGYKLRAFLGDVTKAGTLPDSYVLALRVDSKRRLWIGMSAGGIAQYDEAHDRFDSPVPMDALSRKSVFSIAEDVDGTLLIGTGGGLDRLDPERRTVQRHADWAAAQGLPAVGVQAVLLDRGGAIWAGTDRGLYRRSGNGPFVKVPLGDLEDDQSVVSCVLEDSDGRVWAGTRAHGVFIVEPGMARAQALHERTTESPKAVSAVIVRSMAEAKPGEIWVGTHGQGIIRVDTRNWRVRYTRHVENVVSSLQKNEVVTLFRDRQGLVWVATDGGLSFHDARQTGISTWFGDEEVAGAERGRLSSTQIPFVLPMADGTVWLSAGHGGIDIVSPERGRVRGLRPDPASALTALPDGRVLWMVLSPDGRDVYAGTGRGLYRIAVATLQVQRLTVAGRASTADVRALAWLGDKLWIGGDDGLWGVQAGKGTTLQVFAHDDGTGLGDQRIVLLLPDSDGSLWVGTRSGVVQLDPRTMRVRQFQQDGPGRIGLPGGYTASALKDTQGRMWVASYGAGIRVFEPSPEGAKNLRRVTTAEGLPTNAVNAIAMDAQGDVWASTDVGIVRIAQDTLEIEPLGLADGLGMQVFWSSSVGVTPSGDVLFGGNGGLTIIDPRHAARRQSPPPRLVVTELRLGDGPPLTMHDPSEPGAPALQLTSGRRSLLVEFAALHYAAPEAVRYQYRLLGSDPQWISTDASRRFAAYTNLPPGEHVLELRAAGPKGPWSDPLMLRLQVQPAWHETVWARGAMVLFASGALWLLIRARTLVLRRRELVLKALVGDRTRQLEESQRQLEQIAYFDGLSGLANRRLFNDELKRMVAASLRSGRSAALVLIDLDHFKQINDTFGHDAGDAVLVAVALRLNSAVRETDRVARLGGDEFAILLPEAEGLAAIQHVCERLFAALEPTVIYKGVSLQPSASVGAALCPRDAQTPEDLYKAADVALYDAKRAGRNRWHIASMPGRLDPGTTA